MSSSSYRGAMTATVLFIPSILILGGAAALGGVGSFLEHGLAQPRIELAGGRYYEPAFERGEPVKGVLRLARPVPRAGTKITLRISDSLGRLLLDRTVDAPAGKGPLRELPLELTVPAVRTMRHTITTIVQPPDGPPQAASTTFIYLPPKSWDDYVCGIWQQHNEKRIPYLQEMYLSYSHWNGANSCPPEHFIDAGYRYYVEGGGAWAFSAYHIWMPDKEKTYYHKLAKRAFMADRTNFRILERNPCLSNHITKRRLRWLFTHEGRMHRPYRPLFYSVGDEPGLANQAAPFDYCFSPYCKRAFRTWLKERYKTLEALNAQWGTDYKNWKDVRGATTDEIFARKDDNFSAWCDHKDFMDDVLIGAYAEAGRNLKRHDPAGRIGMGGGQGPSAVGGWDWWKLSQALDVMEAYYIGNNYEFMRSFNPDLIPIHCSFGKGNPEKHLIWYLFIHGDRGLLVWDGGSKYVDDQGNYSARAKEAKQWYGELTGGIGMLRIASRRTDDPVALYHSQANLRVHWVLEVRPSGQAWIHRDSWSERKASRYFRLRESWVKLIEDNGYQWRFLCPPLLQKGALKAYDPKTRSGFKILFLPEILALSDAEAQAIRDFVSAGGTVVADRMPGSFDEHGKPRPKPILADLFYGKNPRAVLLNREMLPYYQQRIFPGNRERQLKDLIGRLLEKAVGADRATPRVVGPAGRPVTGVEVTAWANGSARLIALHRNPLLRIHELGPQQYKSNKKFETPVRLTVSAPTAKCWYDVRAGKLLAKRAKEVTVTLPPFEPVFLMTMPPGADGRTFEVTLAGQAVNIHPGASSALAQPVFHLDFIGPDGKERLVYRQNVTCKPTGGAVPLPLALNEDAGRWTLRVREVATGQVREVGFTVGK